MKKEDLVELGFEDNHGIMCMDFWTRYTNILIRYYYTENEELANCFISTYSDTTQVYPATKEDLSVLIRLFTNTK